jgi:hypothetical protein
MQTGSAGTEVARDDYDIAGLRAVSPENTMLVHIACHSHRYRQ